MADLISQAAIDLIVDEEVSGKAAYEKMYRHPEWPGGASGVTIGIGYDLGYGSDDDIRRDWGGKVPDEMLELMVKCAGSTGYEAKTLLPKVKGGIDISWDAAMTVFLVHDIPKFYDQCKAQLPNFEALSLDCRGALVSLAYNRGASFSKAGDRYSEMRAIKDAMARKAFGNIPAQFRSMKRLWDSQSMRGLVLRREHEAQLFERGLTETA
jgi:GH24 family phage-related lysozyme (muramidase)